MRDGRGEHTVAAFDRRAVSDVIGYVLVFSLVVTVVGVISVAGFSSLENARYAEQSNNAERAFDVLADNIGDVYGDGAPSRGTEISLSEASLATTETVRVNVTVRDHSTSDVKLTFEEDFQPIIWRGEGDTEIVYSMGAVLRDEGDDGLVIQESPSRFGTDRTVIQIIQTRASPEQYSDTTVRVRAIEPGSGSFLWRERDTSDITLNITTPRADLWETHLDRYPDTTCEIVTLSGDSTETVSCEFTDRDTVYVMRTAIDIDIEK